MSEENEKKGKKISQMTTAEIDEKLKEAREKMGGDGSQYIKHLLARKKQLAGS